MSNNKHSFDAFWERAIYPVINACTNEIDPEFSSRVGLQQRNPDEFRIELEKTYKQKRAWLKSEYLPEEQDPSLDYHKLSAILCRCLIGNKCFSYNVNKAEKIRRERKRLGNLSHKAELKWEIDNLLVNYKLAFYVGEAVAYDDMVYWAQSRIKADKKELEKITDESDKKDIWRRITLTEAFLEYLRKDKESGLTPYFCSRTHDDFESSVIVSLMKTDCLMRDFDYLMFGAMMFQWQEYTKRCIFSELLTREISPNNTGYFNTWLQFCLK